jgi:hypothetical protein
MIVYQVRFDLKGGYQYVLFEDRSQALSDKRIFDCTPRAATWPVQKVYVEKPLLKRGNFFSFLSSEFICDEKARNELADVLEMSGELLPLSLDGEPLYLMNVLGCYNALDSEKSEWHGRVGPGGRLKKFVFHPNRIPDVPLFKIPEMPRTVILTAVGAHDKAYEFKTRVEKANLKGLVFEELWRSEDQR